MTFELWNCYLTFDLSFKNQFPSFSGKLSLQVINLFSGSNI